MAVCRKCKTHRIIDDRIRKLENETGEPCKECKAWLDMYFEGHAINLLEER